MLILNRAVGEEILIGANVRITALCIQGKRVRLGIEAPRSVPIDRLETHDRKQAERQARAAAQRPSTQRPAAPTAAPSPTRSLRSD